MEYPIQSLSGREIIIFGCGYVGKAVAKECLLLGAKVTGLTRNPEKAEALTKAGLSKVIIADLNEPDIARHLGSRYDFALNCVSSGGGGLDNYHKSYVEGQQSIANWAARLAEPLQAFTYTSSTSVYPDSDGALLSEADASSEHSPRAAILMESEQAALSVSSQRKTVLRLGGIYGPGRHYMLDMLRSNPGEPLYGSGDTYLNSIHLDDIVSAIIASWLNTNENRSAIYNVVDNEPAQRKTIAAWLAERYQLPTPVFEPDKPSPRMIKRGIKNGSSKAPNRRISNTAIQQALAWQPKYKSFREGYAVLD